MKSLIESISLPAVLSTIVVLGFFAVLILAFFHAIPESQTVSGLIGALTIAFGNVISYLIGSSRSSQVKDATISQLAATQPALLAAPPPAKP